MLDAALRPIKDRLLAPIVRAAAPRAQPAVVTLVSLVACVGAGAAAAARRPALAVGLWLAGRLLDGLDGAVARARDAASDLGGYLDQLADTIGYAAVPLGVAASSSDRHAWVLVALLLASFYVNTLSWTYLSALAEKRAVGAGARGESTSIHMPTGLVEGAETIVLFAAMLAFPSAAPMLCAVMGVAVAATVLQRVWWARRHLGADRSATGAAAGAGSPSASRIGA